MVHGGLPELLQQRYDENHRGRMIFTGQQLGPLRARSVHKIKELDPRFHEPLARAGLLPFALMMAGAPMEVGGRTPLPAIDEALLTGLVDRWRPETHTFHFPFGEMAVTLRDVAMLTGLPIRGAPLIVSRPAREQWKGYVADRFGVQYDGKDAGLSMSWVHGLTQFGPCPLDADENTLMPHYEVYLYVLLGGIMFCNTAGDYVVPHIVWLAAHLASHPYEPTSYSWGSAVLAATYRGLCDATQRTKRKATITGCLHLLQLWSWEYLPVSRPWVLKCYYPVHISDGIADDIRPTMGYRWIHARLRWSQQQDHGNYSRVISDLDILSADLVDWDPWRMARVKEIADGGLLASSCSRDADLWLTTCFLLYMNCVEVYSPERVQRQFGYRQVVPVPAPRDAGRAHEWSSKGGGGTQDWASKNAEYIRRWTESAAVDVIITAGQYDEATYWDYLAWYRPRTRATLLSGPVQPGPRPFPEDRARLLHVVTEEAYEMHTQADQSFGEPSRSSSQRDRNPLREYMRTRGSRFLNAIRGLGGCAPQWRGYDQHAMDPSRASHSRRSSSAREEPVRSESRHTSSASARHVSCSGAEAEECTQPPAPEQVTLGSLAPPATMTPPAVASTHQEDVVDYTQQTPCWSDPNAFDWGAAMHATATFTDLLGGQSSHDLNEPGSSHWYQHGEPSAHWTPSEHVLGPSTLPHEDPSAWYMQSRVSGAGYTFGGVPTGQADDDEDDQGHARQGPAQAAGMRATHPPDAYTPGDCVRHRRR